MRGPIECFYPGSSFPAISVTGGSCALNCKHCARRYLEGMIPAGSPSELVGLAEALAERGAKGFLLSGGSDETGRVPLGPFSGAIRTIKSSTDLLINAHVGLASESELRDLVSSGVDAFSADIYGSDETIREVLGIERRANDYFTVVRILKDLEAKVAPHLCVGVEGGVVRGEFEAIERLAAIEPEVLILISLIPTRGTAYESAKAPSTKDLLDVIRAARFSLPRTKLILGCMRSKKDRSSEYQLVEAGLDGVVLPSPSTVRRLVSEGYETRKRLLCCAFAGTHL